MDVKRGFPNARTQTQKYPILLWAAETLKAFGLIGGHGKDLLFHKPITSVGRVVASLLI